MDSEINKMRQQKITTVMLGVGASKGSARQIQRASLATTRFCGRSRALEIEASHRVYPILALAVKSSSPRARNTSSGSGFRVDGSIGEHRRLNRLLFLACQSGKAISESISDTNSTATPGRAV